MGVLSLYFFCLCACSAGPRACHLRAPLQAFVMIVLLVLVHTLVKVVLVIFFYIP